MEEKNVVLNVPEVAKYLSCNVSSIRKLVRAGKIPVWRIGSKLNFSKTSIDKWIERTRIRKSKI